MVLYLNDLLNEFSRRGFTPYETRGELLILSVPNARNIAETIPVAAEFQGELLSASTMIAQISEEGYILGVRLCAGLNAETRWYKHFLQPGPAGDHQVCVAADWVTKDLPAETAFRVLMDFTQYVYQARDRFLNA